MDDELAEDNRRQARSILAAGFADDTFTIPIQNPGWSNLKHQEDISFVS